MVSHGGVTAMQQAVIDGLAKEILSQLEGGDKEDVRKLVLTYLAKEAKRRKSKGEKITPDGFALVCAARVLKEENHSADVFRRFTAEVREWRRIYPIALGGRVRWKKLFDLPRKKGSPIGPSDEVLAAIAAQNSAIAELTAKANAMFTELGDACKRIQQLETGLTNHGEASTRMEAEFHKLEELVTGPSNQQTNALELISEFAKFLLQRK